LKVEGFRHLIEELQARVTSLEIVVAELMPEVDLPEVDPLEAGHLRVADRAREFIAERNGEG
jgi:hypothetical protein